MAMRWRARAAQEQRRESPPPKPSKFISATSALLDMISPAACRPDRLHLSALFIAPHHSPFLAMRVSLLPLMHGSDATYFMYATNTASPVADYSDAY